jgi:hypothetical protein
VGEVQNDEAAKNLSRDDVTDQDNQEFGDVNTSTMTDQNNEIQNTETIGDEYKHRNEDPSDTASNVSINLIVGYEDDNGTLSAQGLFSGEAVVHLYHEMSWLRMDKCLIFVIGCGKYYSIEMYRSACGSHFKSSIVSQTTQPRLDAKNKVTLLLEDNFGKIDPYLMTFRDGSEADTLLRILTNGTS